MTEQEMNEYFKILWKYLPPNVAISEPDKARLLEIEAKINTELKTTATDTNQQYIAVMRENAKMMADSVKEQAEIFRKCESHLYTLTVALAELARKK
jgi:hypothetical protein